MRALLIFSGLLAVTSVMACDDYASWRQVNEDCAWTTATEEAVIQSSLPQRIPTDVTSFCPNYANLDALHRSRFWVGLLSAMARPESNYNPAATYTESFDDGSGNRVISRGLLQISIESANQQRYACGIEKDEDLHIPRVNLQCGVKILEAWVVNDNVIASYQKPSRGGGRYWSVLRASNNRLPEIMGITSSLAFCQE